jgi:acetyltransferase-like isoleucine patch superfamily enzyme
MMNVEYFRQFFLAHGARIVHDGENCASIYINSFAHYEDATSGSITWMRHPPSKAYEGTVLILNDPYPHHCLPEQLIVQHSSPRTLVTATLKQFFLHNAAAIIRAPSALVQKTALLGVEAQNYECIDGRWQPIPAVGGVFIGKDVHILDYTTVVRGTVGNTTIEDGCRIGRYVNIGHDTRLDQHTLIVSHASLAGWVRVGKRCRIYQGAMIRNGVRIGDDAIIGMGAVVTKNVGPGEIWAGNPARCIDHVKP